MHEVDLGCLLRKAPTARGDAVPAARSPPARSILSADVCRELDLDTRAVHMLSVPDMCRVSRVLPCSLAAVVPEVLAVMPSLLMASAVLGLMGMPESDASSWLKA